MIIEKEKITTLAENQEQPRTDPYLKIMSLARAATSKHAFFNVALDVIYETFDCPFAALYISMGADVMEKERHQSPSVLKFWKHAVQDFLTEALENTGARFRLFKSVQEGHQVAFLSAPLVDSLGSAAGAVALVISPADEDMARRQLAHLVSMATLISHSAVLIEKSDSQQKQWAGTDNHQAMVRGVGKANSLFELAFFLTNSLRNHLGCEQISLGMIKGRKIKILSVSGMDHVENSKPGIVPLKAAMEECADFNKPLVCQRQSKEHEEDPNSGHLLHLQLRNAAGGDAVASIPLDLSDEPYAVVTIRRNSDQPFTGEELDQIRDKVLPYMPLLALADRASRGLVRHAWERAVFFFSPFQRDGFLKRKLALYLAIAGILWFFLGKIDHRLVVPCTIAPAEIRHAAMPFDGTIAVAHAMPGDRVTQGTVLCELDTRELDEERSSLLAERAVLEQEYNQALASKDPVEMQLIEARMKLIEIRLTIVENRMERGRVRASLDGMIISGDPREIIGNVLTKGDPLYEICPMEGLILEIEIPERDIDELNSGMAGYFAPYARPEEQHDFHVSLIHPSAEINGNKIVIIAHGKTDGLSDWIRPGMEGSAVIPLGPQPVWWIVCHRAVDYLRLKWLP